MLSRSPLCNLLRSTHSQNPLSAPLSPRPASPTLSSSPAPLCNYSDTLPHRHFTLSNSLHPLTTPQSRLPPLGSAQSPPQKPAPRPHPPSVLSPPLYLIPPPLYPSPSLAVVAPPLTSNYGSLFRLIFSSRPCRPSLSSRHYPINVE